MSYVGSSSSFPGDDRSPTEKSPVAEEESNPDSGEGEVVDLGDSEVELDFDRLERQFEKDFFIEVDKVRPRRFLGYSGRRTPDIWISRPCFTIQSLPSHITEEDVRRIFSELTVSSIAFDESHNAVIRFYNIDRHFVHSFLYLPQKTKIRGEKFHRTIFSLDVGLPLFVGNIPVESSEDNLIQLFRHHGQIDRAFIARDSDGRSMGFGFVEYCLESATLKAESEIPHYSSLGLFVERATMRDFDINNAVSLAVLEFPIRSLEEASSSLLQLFQLYGRVLGHYIDLPRSRGFVDFSATREADYARISLNGCVIEGRKIKVFFSCPGRRVTMRQQENELGISMGGAMREDYWNLTNPLVTSVRPSMPPHDPVALRTGFGSPHLFPFFSPRPQGTGVFNVSAIGPQSPAQVPPPYAPPSPSLPPRVILPVAPTSPSLVISPIAPSSPSANPAFEYPFGRPTEGPRRPSYADLLRNPELTKRRNEDDNN